MKKRLLNLAPLSLSTYLCACLCGCISNGPRRTEAPKGENGQPANAQADRDLVFLRLAEAPKVSASKLDGDLSLEAIRIGKTAGALLKTDLGAEGDYISYTICSAASDSTSENCVRGKTATLGEPVFDLPAGKLKASFQTCVVKERAITAECGKRETTYYVQAPFDSSSEEAKNERLALIALTKLSRQIQAEAFTLQEAVKAYSSSLKTQSSLETDSGSTKEWQTIIANLKHINPYQMGLLFDSPFWPDLKTALGSSAASALPDSEGLQLTARDSRPSQGAIISGSTLFSLGSLTVLGGLWGHYAHLNRSTTVDAGTNLFRMFGWGQGPAIDAATVTNIDDFLAHGLNYLKYGYGHAKHAFGELMVKAEISGRNAVSEPKAPSKTLAETKSEFDNGINWTKSNISEATSTKIALGGALFMITGVIVSSIEGLGLADNSDSAQAQLVQKAAASEERIEKLRAEKLAIYERLQL